MPHVLSYVGLYLTVVWECDGHPSHEDVPTDLLVTIPSFSEQFQLVVLVVYKDCILLYDVCLRNFTLTAQWSDMDFR